MGLVEVRWRKSMKIEETGALKSISWGDKGGNEGRPANVTEKEQPEKDSREGCCTHQGTRAF